MKKWQNIILQIRRNIEFRKWAHWLQTLGDFLTIGSGDSLTPGTSHPWHPHEREPIPPSRLPSHCAGIGWHPQNRFQSDEVSEETTSLREAQESGEHIKWQHRKEICRTPDPALLQVTDAEKEGQRGIACQQEAMWASLGFWFKQIN